VSAHAVHDYSDPSLPPRLCQNCATPLRGPYCSACGQHDIDYHRSFHHLIHDLLENLLHFEGKFFATIAWLLAKPGHLTNEFNAGRRQSQVNPVRLYIFVSVLFFVGVALLNHGHLFDLDRSQIDNLQFDVGSRSDQVRSLVNGLSDEQRAALDRHLQTLSEEAGDAVLADPDKLKQVLTDITAAAPAQAPASETKPGTPTTFSSRSDRLTEKLKSGELKFSEIVDAVEHRVPTLFFFGVPLFALWLKLFHLRSRRYFIEHLVFSLHVHTWAFLAAMVCSGYVALAGLVASQVGNVVGWILTVWALWYGVAALHNVYGQSWVRSAAKALVLVGLHGFTLLMCGIALVLGTIFWLAA